MRFAFHGKVWEGPTQTYGIQGTKNIERIAGSRFTENCNSYVHGWILCQ
jgi:hypothetical protein